MKNKTEKLGHGLLRHGGGAVRRADAAGGRDPHCHVHCACAGRVSDRDSVCGVRAHHGAHSLRGGQPAGAFVCAGQGSGPDLRVPAGVLPAGKTPVRPHPPGRAAVRCVCKLLLCNAAVLAMYGLLLVLIPAGSISQELRTTAWIVTLSTLAMGNVAFCCTTGPCTTCSCCTGWCGSPSCTGCWACTENDCCTAVAQNGKAWYTEPPAAHRGRRKRECKTTS